MISDDVIVTLLCKSTSQGKCTKNLADAEVSARQRVYEGSSEEIYSKSTICDFLL